MHAAVELYVKVRNDILKVVGVCALGFAGLVGYQLYQQHEAVLAAEAQQAQPVDPNSISTADLIASLQPQFDAREQALATLPQYCQDEIKNDPAMMNTPSDCLKQSIEAYGKVGLANSLTVGQLGYIAFPDSHKP